LRIVLISDTYPPLSNSGAIQLRDLASEFASQGHHITVIVADSDIQTSSILQECSGIQVFRIKTYPIKDVGYVRRTLSEFFMPFAMIREFRRSELFKISWEGILWYSPSIFHTPFVNYLKWKSGCKAYLIIRDIFPDWAVDIGLMKKNLPYLFFTAVARYQYLVANIIGVQSPSNEIFFKSWNKKSRRSVELLPNWLGKKGIERCPIRVEDTVLAGRRIMVYAGNMGKAQGIDIILNLAEKLHYRTDIGFLMVGRGSEFARLKHLAQKNQMKNILFFDQIEPEEIPELFTQCEVGIITLDHRHKTHNIPGKFLTYLQSGLPVLANVNAGNDLAKIIRINHVGEVCETNKASDFHNLAEKLLSDIKSDQGFSSRCEALFESEFAVENKVKQIIHSLS